MNQQLYNALETLVRMIDDPAFKDEAFKKGQVSKALRESGEMERARRAIAERRANDMKKNEATKLKCQWKNGVGGDGRKCRGHQVVDKQYLISGEPLYACSFHAQIIAALHFLGNPYSFQREDK